MNTRAYIKASVLWGMCLVSFSSFAQAAERAQVLQLGDFVGQVKNQHSDFKAAQESAQAAALEVREADLMYSFRLFSRAQYVDDAQPQIFFQYDKQLITTLEAGVEKQTSFGLSGKASYLSTKTNIRGLLFGGTSPRDVDAQSVTPKLELTFSLWRNFLGREVRSAFEAQSAKSEAQHFAQSYKQRVILVQAESSYWALALAREAVTVSTAAVDRAQKLFEWHQRRAGLGLADQADFLQAQANLQAKKLEFRKAQDDETSAARAFNSARGQDSVEVPESLAALTPDLVGKFEIPPRMEMRDDLRAAQAEMRAVSAQAEASRQRLMPTLEVFGSTARNNPNLLETSKAYDNSFSGDRPTHAVGIRLNTSLDFGSVGAVREGYAKDKLAANFTYERKLFEQTREWQDLTDKFKQAKERLQLYIQLESVQKNKLDYERNRRTNGRSTTQQVLLSELDYEQAQLGRIRTLSEILQLVAQMKLYGDQT